MIMETESYEAYEKEIKQQNISYKFKHKAVSQR
jgi:hypothetical protein